MLDRPLGRRRRRLRAHRARRLVADRHRRHPPRHRQRRREGARLAAPARAPARPATARCPTAADNALVTAAEVVRRLGGVPYPAATSATCGRRSSAASTCPTDLRGGADRSGAGRRGDRARSPPAYGAARPRLHAHDDLAERRSTAGRRRTRSPTSSTSTSTSAPFPATRSARRRRLPRRGPRRAGRAGRDQRRCSTREPTRSPTDNELWDVVRTRRRRSPTRVPSWFPGMIVGGTDARFYRQQGHGGLRRGAVLARASRSSRSASASTATTSASTSSRSGCAATSSTGSASELLS